MMRGSDTRKADFPVHSVFLDRWSPDAMSGEEISEPALMELFEAARWAPSSYNEQPWRILYARRNTPHWAPFLDLLAAPNQRWAQHAAALLLFVSKTTFNRNGARSVTHSFDTGAAWENLALQGTLKGWVVHGMQGFDYERARVALRIPAEFRVEAMAAVGRPARAVEGVTGTQQAESPSGRRALASTVCEGPFQFP